MQINDDFLQTGITFTSCDQVQEICSDFFSETDLTYYNYVRVYDDGSRICLSNNRDWMLFVFSNHDKFKITFEEKPEHGTSRYVIWDNVSGINEDSLMIVAKQEFDIAHGFTIINAYNGYVEFQYFGTTQNRSDINNFYINNLGLLHNFGMYFRDRAHALIEQAEKTRFKTPGQQFFWLKKDEATDQYVRSNYFTETNEVERYYLSGELSHVYLTKREAQCLTALIDGMTAKEIGKFFDISFRTVENYLNDIKQKLSCRKRSDLVTTAHNVGFKPIAQVIRERYFDQAKISSSKD